MSTAISPELAPWPATRILHVSDIHFGGPADVDLDDAIEEHIQRERYDVVAISGDVSQRARAGEFQRARAFLRDASRVSRTIIVPGNHDVMWWTSPLHVFGEHRIFAKYRKYIAEDLEPVLRVPGATFVGLNTAHGVSLRTLTKRPRDISIIGDLRPEQIAWAARQFQSSPTGEARIIVMHHNVLRGQLSNRFGLRHPARTIEAFAEMGVDLVLCGHDHQEAVAQVTLDGKPVVICTAGTLSDRSRGNRPSALHAVEVERTSLKVTTLSWNAARRALEPGPTQVFDR